LLDELRQSLTVGDMPGLRRAAHTLKGTIRMFGLATALEHALQLELMGKEGCVDHVGEVLPLLEREVAELLQALQQQRPAEPWPAT
jgi:HPt (histidine-containing phosphotransfer) domain-containing protein